MSSSELVDAYLKSQAGASQPQQVADLSDQISIRSNHWQVVRRLITTRCNGREECAQRNTLKVLMMLVDSGQRAAIQLAVKGLMAEYENQNGYEGRCIPGKDLSIRQMSFSLS